MSRKAKEETLMRAAKEVFRPLKFTEFRCPHCGGVAAVHCLNEVLHAECYGCGVWKKERK